MEKSYDKEKQFHLSKEEYLKKLDVLNWLRFFSIIKEIIGAGNKEILEIGPGEGTIKSFLSPFVERYETLDLNEKLNPDHAGDVREFKKELRSRYDCLIAADILEHIPFADLEKALKNMYSYLKSGGQALITIPHRAWFLYGFSWLFNYKQFIVRAPDWKRTLYQRLRGRKSNPIDPDHEWEIGDGEHSIKDVEDVMKKSGFKIEKQEKLPYVDFWILKKI